MATAEVPIDRPVSYRRQYRRCGKQECLVCSSRGPGHGPYWYAYWREGGRTRSRYFGRVAPPGVPDAAGDIRVAPTPAPADTQPLRVQKLGLRVRSLGGFTVLLGGEVVPNDRWRRPTVTALFKLLLSVPGHRLTRDQALDALWPEAEPDGAAARLRVTIHRLRQVVGADHLDYHDEVLALAPVAGDTPWLDADAFDALAQIALKRRDPAACRAALTVYEGEYLPDDRYAEWTMERREDLCQRWLTLLLHAAALYADAGEIEEAERHLRLALAADPCHEEAALALMQLYAAADRPAQALRTYRRLAAALHEGLGLVPAAQTRSLYQTLARQQRTLMLPAAPPKPAVPTNLPEPLTSFIGRSRELAELRALLWSRAVESRATDDGDVAVPCRLLTLTGAGGCGKTRLAMQLADDLLDEYPDGVWLVELAALSEPELIGPAVARALGLREDPARLLLDTLMAALRAKKMLLILDNCEHLLAACAELATTLLEHCPALHILATSREALAVAGERVWLVPPLSLPDATAALPAGRLLEAESARLFLDRARAQRPALALTDENAVQVAAICRRLDGLPLAIELAAARVGVLGVEAIMDLLREDLRLLTGGPRSAPRRQRTLRATMDWSYSLLSEAEQRLLRRLAVFTGGCTLEAAAMVCAEPLTSYRPGLLSQGPEVLAAPPRKQAEGSAWAVLDLLDGLVRKSLLITEKVSGTTRFRLLQIVRQYAAEHLADAGEVALAQARHAAWVLELVEDAWHGLMGPEQSAWIDRLKRENDNLQAALQWSLGAGGDPYLGLMLTGLLESYWFRRGSIMEGLHWQTLALDRNPQPSWTRSRVLLGMGSLIYLQGDYSRARNCMERGIHLCRDLGDTRGLAVGLNNLAAVLQCLGEYRCAYSYLEESLMLYRDLGETYGIANALDNLGGLAQMEGNLIQAQARYTEALSLFRTIGHKQGIAISLHNLGVVALRSGSPAIAASQVRDALALSAEQSFSQGVAWSLDVLAVCLERQGQPDVGAQLAGAAEALLQRSDMARDAPFQTLYQAGLSGLRAALGEDGFSRAWAIGQRLPLDTVIALALAPCPSGDGHAG